MVGLDRKQAAAWAAKVVGYQLQAQTLYYWESRGLLRRQRPGRRSPASYGIHDLVRLRVLVTLRRDGATLQRMTKAMHSLRRFLPEIEHRPGSWRLAVDTAGNVVRLEDDRHLLRLTGAPGQVAALTLTLLPSSDALHADAERALAGAMA